VEVCRVCGSSNLEQYLDLGDQAYCNSFPKTNGKLSTKYPLRVWFCHNCTASQLDYTISKEDMFGGDYLYVSGTTKTLQESFQQAADKLVRRLNISTNDLVVDIGSNDGTWLKCYGKDQFTLGIEPSSVFELAVDNGIETRNAFFNLSTAHDILCDYDRPKLVTAAGVFLHLEELHSVVEGIKYLIGDKGTFYLQTLYVGDMIENAAFDLIYHEHLNYWTFFALWELFEMHGLEINDVGHLPIHGGSLELWITKKDTHIVSENVGDWIKRENKSGLLRISAYKKFAAKVWDIRDKLLKILWDCQDEGKYVYAFGAPAKGATLLNTFSIDKQLVLLAIEQNYLKVDRFISGTDIPIIKEDGINPDAYLILPWNFLPEFLIKKLSYIMSGGEFIVPIPEPVVITKDNVGRYLEKRR
jgi:hypothetical protein